MSSFVKWEMETGTSYWIAPVLDREIQNKTKQQRKKKPGCRKEMKQAGNIICPFF